jgi:RNA polymerase sigma-70 factor (ECF subfamily)
MSIAFRYESNRDDASALVNQCFLKILKSLGSFSNSNIEASYFSWIKKIMMNTIIDDFRKNRKLKENTQLLNGTDYIDQFADEEYNEIDKIIEEEALQNMILQLSEMQKNVFNLFAIDGFAHKEIASALSITIDNSKWHLSQARKRLQILLKEQIEKQKTIHHG